MGKMISINIFRSDGVLIAGLSAAALILTAACSSGGGPAGAGGSAAPSLTPRHVLLAAATQARQMTSFTEMVTTQIGGVQGEMLTGTIVAKLKPTLQVAANLRLAAAGQSSQVKEIITGTALYLSTATLTRHLGKPWAKIDLSALKGPRGASLALLVRSMQSDNVSYQAEMLTLAKNARVVGMQTVGGVPTTELAGSLKAAEALKMRPASFRKFLAPALRALGNSTIRFHVWIDGQDRIRKMTSIATVGGQTIHITLTVTSLNQPVDITLPPASQTATLPGL